MTRSTSIALAMLFCTAAQAGPFPDFAASGVPASAMVRWAGKVTSYAPAPRVNSPNAVAAIGPADGNTTSLGDLDATELLGGAPLGTITLEFIDPIRNGMGADLAVFENAGQFFNTPYIFAELAFVEVSTNGVDFARFPAVSLNIEPDTNGVLDPNELTVPFGRNFAGVDTTNIRNLAGVHPTLTGTPFDLAELASDPLVLGGTVQLDAIRFVRVVDIPGNGSVLDSLGNPILDTWLTSGSGGFDIDAVGALHVVPEPASVCLGLLAVTVVAAVRSRAPW